MGWHRGYTVEQTNLWNDQLVKESRLYTANSEQLLYIAVILSALFSILLALIAARSVIRPIKNAQAAAKEIAKGNLLVDLPHAGPDAVGNLVASMAEMKNSLHEMSAALRQSVTKLGEGSVHLSEGTQNAAENADQSARAAESIAANVEQLPLGKIRWTE